MPSFSPLSSAPASPPVFEADLPAVVAARPLEDEDGGLALPVAAGAVLPRSTVGGAAVTTGADTLSRTPTIRAAPVRVPTAAAVLRRIAISRGCGVRTRTGPDAAGCPGRPVRAACRPRPRPGRAGRTDRRRGGSRRERGRACRWR